jgi:1,4-dihydroxy-2-naphthoyl-CoA hydrolase
MSQPGNELDDLGRLLAIMPFAATIGIELESATPQQVTGRLAWSAGLCTAGGVLHGGALMTLADSLGGLCAYLNLPGGAATATISSSVNFLRPVRGGEVHAASRPLHAGRSVIVVQTELRDDSGALAAQVSQAQAVLGGK